MCRGNAIAPDVTMACARCGTEYSGAEWEDMDPDDPGPIDWCEGCSDGAFWSEVSDQWYHEDDTEAVHIGGQVMTEDEADEAFPICPRCGDREPADGFMHVDSECTAWCQYCAANFTNVCDCCGDRVDSEAGSWDDDGDRWYCDSCVTNGDAVLSPGLDSYCTDYHWQIEGSMPMGLEIEAECGDADSREIAHALRNLGNPIVAGIKSDGSLDNGLEVVTHPRDYWDPESPDRAHLESLLAYMRSIGLTAWDRDNPTCGLHITVARDAIISTGWIRVATLYRREETLLDLGRRFGSTIHWSQPWSETLSHTIQCAKGRVEQRAGKYCSLNFKGDLVEFRGFQGTLNTRSLLCYVDTVRAMLTWSIDRRGMALRECIDQPWQALRDFAGYCMATGVITHGVTTGTSLDRERSRYEPDRPHAHLPKWSL